MGVTAKTIIRAKQGPLSNASGMGVKTIFLVLSYLFLHQNGFSQTTDWVWQHGDSTTNKHGVYGTQGTAAAANKPGSRSGSVTWTDGNGDLWLFGGFGLGASGSAGRLNDLWKYDVSTEQWTWMKGSSTINASGSYGTKGTESSSSNPQARFNACGEIDNNGDLWLFGGSVKAQRSPQGVSKNDLWRYKPSTNNWTWISGYNSVSSDGVYGTRGTATGYNQPAARSNAVFWKDNSGNFRMVGGLHGGTTQYLNDTWRYIASSGNWVWMAGDSTVNKDARYAHGANGTVNPAATSGATFVKLSGGGIWMFGGHGYVDGSRGRLNDLWKYDVSVNRWTFLKGGKTTDTTATYGTQGTAHASNAPAGTQGACGWLDANGNFWIFGGVDGTGTTNHLWKWNGSKWTWMGNGNSRYGTKGLASIHNLPGARSSAMVFGSGSGTIWLFGGINGSNRNNDLWQYKAFPKIEKSGTTTTSVDQFSISSNETSGSALQNFGDQILINQQSGPFSEVSNNLPASSNVVKRYARRWQLKFVDNNGNGGLFNIKFNLGSAPDIEKTYYLLKRTGTSGAFSVVHEASYHISGNEVIFELDLGDLTSDDFYGLGWSDSDAGYALDFNSGSGNGGPDKIQFPIKLNAKHSNFTAECWIKPSAITGNQNLFAQESGSGTPRTFLRILSDGKLTSFLGGSNVPSSQKLQANKWQHVALSYDGTNLKIYINGSLDTTHSVTAEGSASKWIFGCNSNNLLGFDGEADEMRIWDEVRTVQELRSHMHRHLKGDEANLIGYYRFDQTSGADLPDQGATHDNATLQNFSLSGSSSNWVVSTAPIVPEANSNAIKGPGSCLVFDGSNDYVQVSSFLNPSSSNWTMEGWFNSNSLTTVMMSQLDGSGTGRQLIRLENGVLKTSIDGSGILGSTAIGTGEWHHFALSFNGTTLKMYLDGLLEASSNISVSSATGNYQFGCNKGRSIFFDGKLDELRFWSSTRTQAEIQDNMYASVASDATGLVAYYLFDHFNGTLLEDASSNSNTGTLKNFPWNCWTSAAAREPFKTIKAGSHNSGSTWKDGTAPSSSTDQLAVFHDVTLSATGTYQKMQVSSGVTVTASADVTVNGDVIINGTLSGSNKLILGGSTKQCLGGSGSVGALQVNNSNDISLEGDLTISGALTLTSGDIEVNNHTLTLLGTTSHGSSTSYIKLNGSGNVKATVGSDPVILPVGRNPYLPIIIDDGGGAEYTVGVADKVYGNPATQTTELTTHCVSETWTVQASQSVSNVNIQVGWDAAEEQSGFNRPKSSVAYWENGVSSSWTQGTVGVATGSDPYFRTIDMSSMSTNLYYFGVGSGTSPLPVELTYFNAQWLEKGRSASLQWETGSETDNSHFEVERSFDGVGFETIGHVQGHGTTNASQHYEFQDYDLPESGKSVYYRLKQVDFGGEFEYSAVEVLHVDGLSMVEVQVYPNPARHRLNIASTVEVEKVIIYNAIGVPVEVSSGSQPIDVSRLPSGTYLLEVHPVGAAQSVHKTKVSIK